MSTAEPSAPVVALDGVSKVFAGRAVVDQLDLAIEGGTIAGLIGPSGCGKTTSIRLMTGAYRPSEGSVRVLGRDPTHLTRSQRRQIGYLPQQPTLYPQLTMAQNLRFLSAMNGVGRRRRHQLRDVLDLVDLTGSVRTRVADASGGMQRRLALAATLAHDPVLLFLDEPTAGIDPILRARFWDHFRALRDRGRCVIVTTQYVGEAAWCDAISVISEGQLLLTATPEGLRRSAFGGQLLAVQVARPITAEEEADLRTKPSVVAVEVQGIERRVLHLTVDDAAAVLPRVLDWCRAQELEVQSSEEVVPDFDEVFVRLVEDHRRRSGVAARAS